MLPLGEDRPDADLILGLMISPNGMYKIIRAHGTHFLTNQAYQFTGIRSHSVAELLYKNLVTSLLPMREMAALAIHILGHMKRTVPGIGGNSDVFLLNRVNGEYLHIPTSEAERLERLYAKLDVKAHNDLAKKIIKRAPSNLQLTGFVTQSASGT
jgi:hypothetical protein